MTGMRCGHIELVEYLCSEIENERNELVGCQIIHLLCFLATSIQPYSSIAACTTNKKKGRSSYDCIKPLTLILCHVGDLRPYTAGGQRSGLAPARRSFSFSRMCANLAHVVDTSIVLLGSGSRTYCRTGSLALLTDFAPTLNIKSCPTDIDTALYNKCWRSQVCVSSCEKVCMIYCSEMFTGNANASDDQFPLICEQNYFSRSLHQFIFAGM